jgi:hypothetical protein
MPQDAKAGSPLPAPDTTRWTHRRKAAVVIGLRAGTITRSEASERYKLSHEELSAWEEAFDRYGIDGLILKARRWLLSREGKSEPPLGTSPTAIDAGSAAKLGHVSSARINSPVPPQAIPSSQRPARARVSSLTAFRYFSS